ncbi:discoidin domain-containing protein [Reinekea blandensis]|uniref:Putative secreted protein n=1 Tax=Reinekea blandensis MED297 TaxID=314283 RepID=A4BD19_9GAMM|nr:discoidin domain-containing protein [Reinekea blandensis]EAR10101.1 putative secreted protein [Reinekea sp. MED297] [Reinekea blandensis MED297]
MNHHISLLGAAILLSSAASTNALDYNDPYWANPNINTDFVDHFDSPTLNRNVWKVESDIFVNGEDIDYQDVEYPSPDWTIRSGQPDIGALDGAALNLKARFMDGEIQDLYNKDGKPLFIRSGRIESQITDDTTFTYGKFEARLKMPPARHAEFPAWWLLGNYPDVGWTACQELDIVEFTGANPDLLPQTFWTAPYTVHGGVGLSYQNLGIPYPSNSYNTYGVIKTPDKVEWYVNGQLTQTFSRDNQGDDQPWPYVTPMRMILNHAISHVEWPDVGHYLKWSTDPNVANATGSSYVDEQGIRQYEYIDVDGMAANIGREGTDFLVDYVAHWPLPDSEPTAKYVDNSKYSFFRDSNNTRGFYNLRGWLAPVSVTGDAWEDNGYPDDYRSNGPDNAADGYVGSKWSTPADDELHWIDIDYGANKNIDYLWIEWGWNLPAAYDIYGKTDGGDWELVTTREQSAAIWSTHTMTINKTYRHLKLVTKGRIDKANPIWLLEFKAFEDVPDQYPMPAGTVEQDPNTTVLNNGDFSDALQSWNTESFNGADPVFTADNGALTMTLTDAGADEGSVQLHQNGFTLERDYRYELSFDAHASANRDLVVRVSQDDLNPSPAMTSLKETLSLSTTPQTYQFVFDYAGMNSSGRLAFLMGNLGTEGLTLDNVVLRRTDYLGTGEPLVAAMDATNLVSVSDGWETDWWGVASRAVDGSLDTRASGNDGQSEGQDLSVSVRIPEFFEVKEVLIAGDNSPERSLDQFKVNFGDGQTLMDWTPSSTDGVYESFNQFQQTPPMGERDFEFFFRPPAGGLVEVTDVQLMAIDHKPYRIYVLPLDGNGRVTPASGVRYSNSQDDSATYTFTPAEGESIADVLIDGVSVGAVDQYTFNNIDANHTIAISFTSGNGPTDPNPTNVAPGATVTTSSAIQPVTLINDTDPATRWESAFDVATAEVVLDFGHAMSLSHSELHWEAANAAEYRVQGSADGQTWTTLYTHRDGAFGARTDAFPLSGQYRYLKLSNDQRSDGNLWGYSVYEWEVYGEPADGSTPDPVEAPLMFTSASASTSLQTADFAIDNNGGTRWESTHQNDGQWFQVDLGAVKTLMSLSIDWEAANAAQYEVLVSTDGVNWNLSALKNGGQFGNRSDQFKLDEQARYVRLNLLQRSDGNLWGYSIFEISATGF